jgi:HPt (histidine-containing phosphotransfer) domain-containing protein
MNEVSSASNEVVDSNTIANLREVGSQTDNDSFLGEIIGIFLSHSESVISELGTSIREGKTPQIKALAHKLKGSARNLGAVKLASWCEKIEEVVKQTPTDVASAPALQAALQGLEETFVVTKSALQSEIRTYN